MTEAYPDDASDEEKEFIDSELGQAIRRGDISFPPEVVEAARLLREGTPTEGAANPITRKIQVDCLILSALDDVDPDLEWIMDNVVPPRDETS